MKTTLYFLAFSFGLNVVAQSALYNSGNIRILEGGAIGLHTDLINNNAFDQNQGMVGFYDKEDGTANTVSGAFAPVFYDTEINNAEGVRLAVGMAVLNHTNFVVGNIITPRQQPNTFYNFLQTIEYNGASYLSKIDGYAVVTDQQNFVFPVGDAYQIRTLALNSVEINAVAQCAYYREDPANPTSFGQSFDPTKKPRTIGDISSIEFWHLEGSVSSSIWIGWNADSDMAALTNDVATLIPVGWSIAGQSWVNLGTTSVAGSLEKGSLMSKHFVPNDYTVITFASLATPQEMLKLDNYLVTPNGDGVNDFLFIEELELSQDHMLRIFDRNGIKVYEEKNYVNGFTGIANT
ncbi:MAG TPA: gliding motility-associated C-terminal domain-containing protein, partial [Arenibacter sp.]|nr:gliding motility-associated C-terminal domain-containing protein [Arenibacter sp.]